MPTHQPPRCRLFKLCCLLIAATAIMTFILLGMMDAAVREDEARDQMRADRCARETAPAGYEQKDWDKYCEGVGQ